MGLIACVNSAKNLDGVMSKFKCLYGKHVCGVPERESAKHEKGHWSMYSTIMVSYTARNYTFTIFCDQTNYTNN